MDVFVCQSRYLVPLDQLESHLPAHGAWLTALTAAGRVLAAGRQTPARGGVILMKGESRDEIEEILAADPYSTQGIAAYEIIQFIPRPAPVSSESFLALL